MWDDATHTIPYYVVISYVSDVVEARRGRLDASRHLFFYSVTD